MSGHSTHEDGIAARRGIDRRTALKPAAGGAIAAGVWVAPAIQGFSIVPGYAAFASAGCQVPALAPWTQALIGTWQAGSGSLGGFAAGTAPSPYNVAPFNGAPGVPIYLVEADPPAGTYTLADTPGSATYTSSAFTLTAASTFTFTFSIRWRDTDNHVATQRVEAQWARALAGPWTTGYSLQTVLTGTGDNIHDVAGAGFSLAITGATAGTYFFRYKHTFQGTIGTANNQRANDIAETLPVITCV